MLEINDNFEEFFRPSFSSYTGKFRYLITEQKTTPNFMLIPNLPVMKVTDIFRDNICSSAMY